MGNYYEGELVFPLTKDLPGDLLHDLTLMGSGKEYSTNDLRCEKLKESKWINHHRAISYPSYNMEYYDSDNIWVFSVSFCMKGYVYLGDDLGQDIYDFLHPYLDQKIFNNPYGGYLGRIEDEDGTYRKEFYADYTQFNKIVESRQYICGKCNINIAGSLCKYWNICKRAYKIGRGDAIESASKEAK